MKKIMILFLVTFVGCTMKFDTDILGVWNVQSDFYKAKYKIEQRGNRLVGALLYYNDDTKELIATNTDKDIFLKNIKSKNGVFVDGMSGATISDDSRIEIVIKSKDTLEVTSQIMKQTLKEFWIREK